MVSGSKVTPSHLVRVARISSQVAATIELDRWSSPVKRLERVLEESWMCHSDEPHELAKKLLGSAIERIIPKGHMVAQVGDEAEQVWLIEEGRIDSVRSMGSGEKILTVLHRGDVAGEIGVIFGLRRAATLVARNECLLWELPARAFQEHIADHERSGYILSFPFVKAVDWSILQHTEEEGHMVKYSMENHVAKITLARPSKRNALNLAMLKSLNERYDEVVNSGAKCVLTRGEGRAFCIGGDLPSMMDLTLEGRLHEFLATLTDVSLKTTTSLKPAGIVAVAFLNGIVLGGGWQISMHYDFRIVTESTVMLLPEVDIGLCACGCGLSWWLPRLAGPHIAKFLAMTGHRLRAADMLRLGIATHFCPADRFDVLQKNLVSLGELSGDHAAVRRAIDDAVGGVVPDLSKAMPATHFASIQRCFGSSPTVEEIICNCEAEGSSFCERILSKLHSSSPIALKVTMEIFEKTNGLQLVDAARLEYSAGVWFDRPQPHSDFFEGVRAFIQNDKVHNWSYSTLEDIPEKVVQGYFAPLPSSVSKLSVSNNSL